MTVGQRFLTYYFKFLFSAQEGGDHISHVALFVALQSVKTVSNRLHTLHKLCQKFDVGIFEWANPHNSAQLFEFRTIFRQATHTVIQ